MLALELAAPARRAVTAALAALHTWLRDDWRDVVAYCGRVTYAPELCGADAYACGRAGTIYLAIPPETLSTPVLAALLVHEAQHSAGATHTCAGCGDAIERGADRVARELARHLGR